MIVFDKLIGTTFNGSVYSVACPHGACGAQTLMKRSFSGPGGLAFDADGDLRIVEGGVSLADTFEFPRTHAHAFAVMGVPTGIAINDSEHHWFVADGLESIRIADDDGTGRAPSANASRADPLKTAAWRSMRAIGNSTRHT